MKIESHVANIVSIFLEFSISNRFVKAPEGQDSFQGVCGIQKTVVLLKRDQLLLKNLFQQLQMAESLKKYRNTFRKTLCRFGFENRCLSSIRLLPGCFHKHHQPPPQRNSWFQNQEPMICPPLFLHKSAVHRSGLWCLATVRATKVWRWFFA